MEFRAEFLQTQRGVIAQPTMAAAALERGSRRVVSADSSVGVLHLPRYGDNQRRSSPVGMSVFHHACYAHDMKDIQIPGVPTQIVVNW